MAKTRQLVFLSIAMVIIVSCGKKLVYFQEGEKSKNTFNHIELAKPENPGEHSIEAGDVLSLKILSHTKEIAEEFSKYVNTGSSVPGLLVQENGTIFLPYTGSLKVSGLSISEVEKRIETELNKSLVNIVIQLTLSSFQVTVLGEVKMPGIKNSLGDKMTLIDAFSLSGDLGNDANRKNIKVIRQSGDKKTTFLVDMSSIDVFRSEAYYLKSNDIIYVEPLPRRFLKENINYISIILSIANTLLIFVRL